MAIQLRVVSKCFGTDSPQTVGSFPHMTDAAWLDWISRFNDFISADLDAMTARVNEIRGPMARAKASAATTAEVLERCQGWISQAQFAGRETHSLEFAAACHLRIEAVVESKLVHFQQGSQHYQAEVKEMFLLFIEQN